MPLPYGTQYKSIMRPEDAPWTAMGSTGQYVDMFGLVSPDDNTGYLNRAKAEQLQSETGLAQQKFDLLRNLFGRLGPSSFNASASFQPSAIPAPRYISAGPVWTQQQIDAQSGLQRSNLMTQANNQSRDFTQNMARSGFSPMSPFAMMNSQNNMMRANAGAAENETKLNFDAAQANSDARLKAGGINAGIYGDYARALANQNQVAADFALKNAGAQRDWFSTIFRGLA